MTRQRVAGALDELRGDLLVESARDDREPLSLSSWRSRVIGHGFKKHSSNRPTRISRNIAKATNTAESVCSRLSAPLSVFRVESLRLRSGSEQMSELVALGLEIARVLVVQRLLQRHTI